MALTYTRLNTASLNTETRGIAMRYRYYIVFMFRKIWKVTVPLCLVASVLMVTAYMFGRIEIDPLAKAKWQNESTVFFLPLRAVRDGLNRDTASSFRYSWQAPSGDTLTGAPFQVSRRIRDLLHIPLEHLSDPLTTDSAREFVFATAADTRYFDIALDAVATVQRHFPKYTIYFFGLDKLPHGLDAKKWNHVQRLCQVKYRAFNFTGLPKHVRTLNTYAWKPIIIHTLLRDHPGVFWIDSSIRFHTGNITTLMRKAVSSGGALLFNYAGHNTFSVTHPGMYSYLPTDPAGVQRTKQREANCMLFYRTRDTYNHVILWLVLCAMKRSCVAPTSSLRCTFHGDDVYAGCHRFDQSAVNILLANRFRFQLSNYSYAEYLQKVRRYEARKETPRLCGLKQNK